MTLWGAEIPTKATSFPRELTEEQAVARNALLSRITPRLLRLLGAVLTRVIGLSSTQIGLS